MEDSINESDAKDSSEDLSSKEDGNTEHTPAVIEERTEIPNPAISPKISRPKLPEFVGGDRSGGCSGHHGRAKTDPGQGAEIKAIIDKTMEDIKELQQVDFTKTYSRPRGFPTKSKSQSTHASPFTSPIPSPSVEENPLLNRNRSRSLKILTDILKGGRYSSSHQHKPTEDCGKSISDSQLLSGKKSDRENERRSCSEGQLEASAKPKVHVCDDNSKAIQTDSKLDKPTNKNKGAKEKIKVGGRRSECKSPELWRQAARKSTSKSPALSDDEGLESDSEHKPLGHTDTNSKFLMFYKIGAPKRRPAYAGLVPLSKPTYQDSSKSDEPNYKRLQRVELRPFSSNGRKTSNSRHVTHPPITKTTFPAEQGAVDSNGFGSLSQPIEEASPSHTCDLQSLASDVSLADSQLGQSVVSEDVSISSDVISPEKIDKRNGRGSKQKSISDPSGSKSIDNADIPCVMQQCHSSPELSKDHVVTSKDDSMIPSRDSVSFDQDLLLSESQHMDLITDLDSDDTVQVSSPPPHFNIVSPTLTQSQSFDATGPPLYVSSFTFEEPALSPSPTTECPQQFLTLPSSSKKNISRSYSSASVLGRDRKYLDKDNGLRKHSMTTPAEAMLLPPTSLADSQSSSMPTLIKNGDKVSITRLQIKMHLQKYV